MLFNSFSVNLEVDVIKDNGTISVLIALGKSGKSYDYTAEIGVMFLSIVHPVVVFLTGLG